jgi:dihydroflavonol-4-reductase
MKIALTGATGFIGSRVAQQLRARGDEVVCIVRTPGRAQALSAIGCNVHMGDVLDRRSLLAGFAGCDGVIHLAASYELGVVGEARASAARLNLEGTRTALEAARDAGASKIVYTSSAMVYGYGRAEPPILEGEAVGTRFPSFYGRSKADAHQIALEIARAGAPLVIVQPGAVIGPRDHSSMRYVFGSLARGLPLTVGDALYGIIDVDECARGHVLALDKGQAGACYHLAAEFMTMPQLMQRAHELTGVSGRRLTLPGWLLNANAALMSVIERFVPVPELLSSDLLRSATDVRHHLDTSRARADLGFAPRKLDEMIRAIVTDDLTRLGKPLPARLTASG